MQGLVCGFVGGDPSALTARGAGAPSLAALSPAVWLEPNPLDTVSGGRLSQAYGLDANARHGVQGTAANQPLVVAGAGPGGRDCWRFASGRPDFLSIAHDAGLTGLDWTFFVVLKTAAGTASLVSKCNAGSARPFDGLVFSNVMNLGGERSGVTAVNSNTWRCVGARRGVAIAEASVWVDGVKNAFGALTAYTNTGDAIRIGQRADGFGSLTGDTAHVSIWTRALSDAEIAQVHTYFTARFGL